MSVDASTWLRQYLVAPDAIKPQGRDKTVALSLFGYQKRRVTDEMLVS